MLVGVEKFELGPATERAPHAYSLQPRRLLRPGPTGPIAPQHVGAVIAADTPTPPLSNIPQSGLGLVDDRRIDRRLVVRPGHLVDAYCRGILAYRIIRSE